MGQLRMLNRGNELLPRPKLGIFEDDEGRLWLMKLQRCFVTGEREYIYDRDISRDEAERIMAGGGAA